MLSDTEAAEDQVQDVVGGGGTGHFVDGTKGALQVEQERLVRYAGGDRFRRRRECPEGIVNQFLVADVGQETTFDLRAGLSTDVLQDGASQLGDARAGEGGEVGMPRAGESQRSVLGRGSFSRVGLVFDDESLPGLRPRSAAYGLLRELG